MNEDDITKLTDYPLIEKLAQALWQRDKFGHGVAIMVGAGFSRCAATTYDTDKKLPIWRDLAQKLADELGESEHTDALRLAQMYQDYFGKARLYDLLKNAVEDEIWEPAELYEQLLSMPWSEVLTTNWDTLLERGAKNIHEPIYDIASKQEDMASCHSPRIVKLHGTINVSSDLIFTQEDYRCYPQKYGIFVNFVRQVFVENELCLIGFSGDDPNFLQWIGWVRDNLQSNARRIYLVGALNLSAAKRKYLESLNVAPIDLHGLVADFDDKNLQHKTVIKLFLKKLEEFKSEYTWDWKPAKINSHINLYNLFNESTKKLESEQQIQNILLPLLKKDRKSYPNWLVCPFEKRWGIIKNLDTLSILVYEINNINKELRDKLLYEIFWLYQVSSKPLDEEYIDLFLRIFDSEQLCKLTIKQQLEIALFLLKYSRWADKDSKLHKDLEKISARLNNNIHNWPELKTELAYHQAIVALDKMDYYMIEKQLDKISELDPIWKLRKAYLLVELAEYQKSANLVKQAVYELSIGYRNNKNSIYFLSRFAWAKYLERIINFILYDESVKVYEQKFTIKKCNPYDFLLSLDNEITDHLEEQNKEQRQTKKTPAFESGHYIDNSNTVSFATSLKITPFATEVWFDYLCNTVGLPFRWKNFNLLSKEAFKFSEISELDKLTRIGFIVRSVKDEKANEINSILSRNKIAQMDRKEVDILLDCFQKAVKYWLNKALSNKIKENQNEIEIRLSIYLELLARMQIRNSIEKAKESFKLAMEIGSKKYTILTCSKSLNHLILYSLQSLPKNKQSEFLVDILNFPLIEDNDYPNAIIYYPGMRDGNIEKITYLIKNLINNLAIKKISSETGQNILCRLFPLIENNFITKEERKELVEIICGKNFDFQHLPSSYKNQYIYVSVLLALCPDNNLNIIKKLIADNIYSSLEKNDFNGQELAIIKNLALRPLNNILPTPEQAVDYFDKLVSWRFSESKDIEYYLDDYHIEKNIAEFIGSVLYTAIVPMLPDEAKNQSRFNALCKYLSEVKFDAAVVALIPFVLLNGAWNGEVQRIIRSGLRSENIQSISYSAKAIYEWGRGLKSDKSVIRPFIEKLIYMIELGYFLGLVAVLAMVNKMLNDNWLTANDINNLIENLPELFEKADYMNYEEENEDVIVLSNIRAECVKLARDILKQRNEPIPALQNILDKAKNDALPEVRFAEQDEYCK